MKTPFLLFTLLFTCFTLYAQDPCYRHSQNTHLGSTIEIWDWQQEQFEFHIPNLDVQFFDSPFFSTDFTGDPNTNYLAFQVEKDFDTKDGWELLYHNPGTVESKVDAPSFALYNRYTGKIQIFVFYYTQDLQPYQTATLEVSYSGFSENQSGLLGFVEMPAEGLDNFTKGIKVESINSYVQGGVWLISEIQSAFDPCSCDYKSLLNIAPRLMQDYTITLDIKGTGESVPIIEEGVPVTGTNGFNSAFNSNPLVGAAVSGQKSYKSLDGFNGAVNGLFSNSSGDDENFASFVADFLKPIPYIGLAVPFLDLLIGGGGDDSDEAEPGPITFSNNYSFNGDGFISTSLPVEITNIATPGSTETSSAFVPDYNNVLGVAGLLKKPIVHKFTIGDDALVTWNLAEDLLYGVNHLAGINGRPVKAKAALIFRSCDVNVNWWGYDIFGEDHPPAYFGLFGGIQEEGSFESGIEFRTPFMDIGCLSDYTVMSSYQTDAFYGYGVRCDDNIDLRLMLVLDREDGQGEEIMFMATYNVDVVEGQSGYVPNPYWGIPETATANTLDEVLDGSVQAWNGVTILSDEVVDADNYDIVNDVLAGDPVEITVYPPNGGAPYVTTIRKEVAVGTEIEGGTLVVNAAPQCKEVSPASYRDIGKFCERSYNPRAESFITTDNPDEETLSEERSEQIIKSKQAVYPNPTAGKVVFQLATSEKQEVEVGLYNTYGNKVKHLYTGELPAGQHEFNFNIRDQVDGVYYLTVREKNNVTTHKVIKNSSLQP